MMFVWPGHPSPTFLLCRLALYTFSLDFLLCCINDNTATRVYHLIGNTLIPSCQLTGSLLQRHQRGAVNTSTTSSEGEQQWPPITSPQNLCRTTRQNHKTTIPSFKRLYKSSLSRSLSLSIKHTWQVWKSHLRVSIIADSTGAVVKNDTAEIRHCVKHSTV